MALLLVALPAVGAERDWSSEDPLEVWEVGPFVELPDSDEHRQEQAVVCRELERSGCGAMALCSLRWTGLGVRGAGGVRALSLVRCPGGRCELAVLTRLALLAEPTLEQLEGNPGSLARGGQVAVVSYYQATESCHIDEEGEGAGEQICGLASAGSRECRILEVNACDGQVTAICMDDEESESLRIESWRIEVD
jgi:hypothetical protein